LFVVVVVVVVVEISDEFIQWTPWTAFQGIQMVRTLSSRNLSTSWQVATVFLPRDCQVPDRSPCVPFGISILVHQRDTHLKIKMIHRKLRNFSQCVQMPQWDILITNCKHNDLSLRDILYQFGQLLEDANPI
jgi:hypothetical protein